MVGFICSNCVVVVLTMDNRVVAVVSLCMGRS